MAAERKVRPRKSDQKTQENITAKVPQKPKAPAAKKKAEKPKPTTKEQAAKEIKPVEKTNTEATDGNGNPAGFNFKLENGPIVEKLPDHKENDAFSIKKIKRDYTGAQAPQTNGQPEAAEQLPPQPTVAEEPLPDVDIPDDTGAADQEPPPTPTYNNEPQPPPIIDDIPAQDISSGPEPVPEPTDTFAVPEGQARDMVDHLIPQVNYGLKSFVAPLVKIRTRPKHQLFPQIVDEIKTHNEWTKENVVPLDKEEVGMIRGPAIQMMREGGVEMSAKQQLITAVAMIMVNKTVKIYQGNSEVIKRIDGHFERAFGHKDGPLAAQPPPPEKETEPAPPPDAKEGEKDDKQEGKDKKE